MLAIEAPSLLSARALVFVVCAHVCVRVCVRLLVCVFVWLCLRDVFMS